LQRVDQGPAGPIVPIQLGKVFAGNQKRGDPPAVVSDADLGQLSAACQQKCPSKNVRGLQIDQKITPISKNISSLIRAIDNQSVSTCQAFIRLDYYLSMTNNCFLTTKTLIFDIFR